MFDNRSGLSALSEHLPTLADQPSLHSIKDSLSSLSYRMSELESALSRKVRMVLSRWTEASAWPSLRRR